MKYYADYFNDVIYAVDTDGNTTAVSANGVSHGHVERHPWFVHENDTCWEVEPMTKEEYEGYGSKWVWSSAPNAREAKEHSWRNYIRFI